MKVKNIMASAIGSSLEWFDFALYGFLGPVLAHVFFSNQDSLMTALVSTYGVFAIGFAARPIGAVLFGYLGDRFGRTYSLKLTPICITGSTVLMALLPSYQTAGDLSPLLLVVARFLQGVFLGGEFAGNIVYLCETSIKWRYLFGSLGSCTGSLGIAFASIVASLLYTGLSHEFLQTWGWRLGFLLAIPIGGIIILLRNRIAEPREFQEHLNSMHESTNSLGYIFRSNAKLILLCIGVILLHATSFYFVFMFIPVYLAKMRHSPDMSALAHNAWFLLLHIAAIPVFGVVVNKFGGKKSLILISTLFIVFSCYLFNKIATGSQQEIMISLIVLSLMTAVNAAIIPGLLAEIIPVAVRYTILAFSFNIAFGIFGGITPYLNMLLVTRFNVKLLPSIYLTLCASVTFMIAIWLLKRGQHREAGKLFYS